MSPEHPPRLAARLSPPIAFAHRGARAVAPENTLDAFAKARELGASGIESDVWLTADSVPVLDHDGVVGGRFRRRPIAELRRAELPAHIPSLEEMYEDGGTELPLSLDVKDDAAFAPVVAVARAAGNGVAERLWLCHSDWERAAEWRRRLDGHDGGPLAPGVKVVDSTRLRRMKDGPERRAATLSHAGVDAVNLHQSDWTGGLVTLFHRFEVLTFAWDTQLARVVGEVLDIGIDAVYGDHVDRLVAALERAYDV